MAPGVGLDPAKLAVVEQMLRDGMTPSQIELVRERLGVGERQVRRYCRAVKEKWAKEGTGGVDAAMVLNVARKAITAGKFAAALQAVNQLARIRDRDGRDIPTYAAAGEVPADPLAAVAAWAQRVACLAMREAALDKTLDPRARREEIRRTARVVAALVPESRTYDAEQTIRRDASAQDEEEDAELENAPVTSTPMRSQATRGRPQ